MYANIYTKQMFTEKFDNCLDVNFIKWYPGFSTVL